MSRLTQLFRIIVTGLTAATAADIGRTVFQGLTGFPAVNWSITGRWFMMVLEGQPYVPDIAMAMPQPYEMWAGHAAYYAISLVFAAVYLRILWVAKREPTLWNGLLFGWVTMAFPFLVQMPLMGMGVMASETSAPGLTMARTLVHHSCFGLGLGLGAMVMEILAPRK